jgi:hypothetical protein
MLFESTPLHFITSLHGLSREGTLPTERPPLVGEVSANFCGSVVWRERARYMKKAESDCH